MCGAYLLQGVCVCIGVLPRDASDFSHERHLAYKEDPGLATVRESDQNAGLILFGLCVKCTLLAR